MQEKINSEKIQIDFKSFFYDSMLPMCLLTTEMKFKAVNKNVLDILGYSEAELIGESVSSITELEDVGFDFEKLSKLLKREINSYSIELSYKKKDNTRYSWSNTVSLLDFEGEECLLSFFHNKINPNNKLGLVSESNETINKILSINPDIHYIMDMQNKNYIYQNIDILNYFGYSEKDLKGKNIIDFLISKIDSASVNEVTQASYDFQKGIPLGEFMTVEYKFLSNKEGWKWLRAKSTPLSTNAAGALVLCYGFIHDITHQKEIEQKLLGQEAFINQIANLVPDVVAVYDINTYDLIYSNLNDRTFLGYNKDEWIDKTTVNLEESYKTHLKDQNTALRNLADDEVVLKEFAYLNKQGESRWIDIKSKVFSRDEKGVPNQILLVAADINDYKTTLLKLAEAKRTNKAILGAIRDLLIVVNREVKYTNVISGLEFRLDDPSDLIGKSLFDVLSEKDAAVLKELVNACLDTGEVKYYDFEHTYPDDRPNAFFSNYISRLNSDEALIVVRDETQKKLAEKLLDKKINLLSIQNEQLEKFISRNSELERFTYIIAHDFKVPLRSVSAISELIELEVSKTKNKDLEKLLGHLSENCSTMSGLIEGVLEYSKIDSEGGKFDINLDVLVQNLLDELSTSIEAENVNVKAGKLGIIKGNETQICQLFRHLIDNAIKFKTNDKPDIIIDKRDTDEGVVYFVEDNGISIEPEFRESIFLMFKKVSSSSKYPGQGVGLSMCKKVVEYHGGRIWIESTEASGSRFCFTIGSD